MMPIWWPPRLIAEVTRSAGKVSRSGASAASPVAAACPPFDCPPIDCPRCAARSRKAARAAGRGPNRAPPNRKSSTATAAAGKPARYSSRCPPSSGSSAPAAAISSSTSRYTGRRPIRPGTGCRPGRASAGAVDRAGPPEPPGKPAAPRLDPPPGAPAAGAGRRRPGPAPGPRCGSGVCRPGPPAAEGAPRPLPGAEFAMDVTACPLCALCVLCLRCLLWPGSAAECTRRPDHAGAVIPARRRAPAGPRARPAGRRTSAARTTPHRTASLFGRVLCAEPNSESPGPGHRSAVAWGRERSGHT